MRITVLLIVTILFLLLMFLSLVSQDFFSSVIPGWHTTILPLYYLISFIAIINFILPGLFFYWLKNKIKIVSFTPFLIHMILSTVITIALKFPMIFVPNVDFQNLMEKTMKVFQILLIVFLLEQLIFGIHLFRISKKIS